MGQRLTIGKHDDEDDQRESPFKCHAEDHQSDRNVDKCREDIEQDELFTLSATTTRLKMKVNHLKCMIDRSATIEDAQNLPCLATRVEGE